MHPQRTSNDPTRSSCGPALLLILSSFALGAFIAPRVLNRAAGPAAERAGAGLPVAIGLPSPLGPEEAYARAAKVASPAVVNIDTRQRVLSDFGDVPTVQTTQGSGFIIDRDGDILTNEHVVGLARAAGRQISVSLADGRKFTGTVIGSDMQSDVALVKIVGKDLPVAGLGTVKGIVPGQMAIAIGNPLGFRFTVTHGVVSALGRPINDDQAGRVYENLVQTDCPINPGNSGGPLVNMQGKVIGINTIVASRAQGIGFAIPIDNAVQVANELKRYGRIKRPWLGMVVQTNTDELAMAYGLPHVPGVVASRLYADGPAASSGLQAGDVITSIDGKPTASEDDFRAVLRGIKIGQTVHVKLQRGDESGTVSILAGEAPTG